jgi:hypothetical protein
MSFPFVRAAGGCYPSLPKVSTHENLQCCRKTFLKIFNLCFDVLMSTQHISLRRMNKLKENSYKVSKSLGNNTSQLNFENFFDSLDAFVICRCRFVVFAAMEVIIAHCFTVNQLSALHRETFLLNTPFSQFEAPGVIYCSVNLPAGVKVYYCIHGAHFGI